MRDILPRLRSDAEDDLIGTTLVYVPTSAAAPVMRSIGAQLADQSQGTSYYSMPCASIATVQLGFSFGGTVFDLDPQDLSLGPIQPGSKTCILGIVGDDEVRLFPLFT